MNRRHLLASATLLCGLVAAATAAWAQASQPTLDAQFLGTDDWLVAPDADHPLVLVVARLDHKAATPGGAAKFTVLRNHQPIETAIYYRTHVAKPEELKVGALVVVAPNSSSRTSAENDTYRASRVFALDDLPGAVVVTPNQVAARLVRVIEGDATPTVAVKSPLDRQYFHDEYWLLSTTRKDLDLATGTELEVAIALVLPAKPGDEGEFLLAGGATVKTRFAWRSRPAEPADLQVGAVLAHLANGSSPSDAVNSRNDWMAGAVTRTTRNRAYLSGEGSNTQGAVDLRLLLR